MTSASFDQEAYRQGFYQALQDRSLAFPKDQALYEPFYADDELTPVDPIRDLFQAVLLGGAQGAYLFSGFRGTGKSTELARLAELLRAAGRPVLAIDIQDYLNLSAPIDLSDFLIVVGGAVSDQAEVLLGVDPARQSYWDRMVAFLTRTEVDFREISFKAGAELKLALRQDPSIQFRIQSFLKGHIGTLVADLRDFVQDVADQLAARHEGIRPVVIFDSFEKFRGTSLNAVQVEAAVENLFIGHADKLRFVGTHCIYSVPPWLPIRMGGLPSAFARLAMLPCLKVREPDGTPCQAGLDAVEKLVRRRGDWTLLLGERRRLDQLALASGGHIQHLFQMLRGCLLRARTLPIKDRAVELEVSEFRNGFQALSVEDARWLAAIAKTRRVMLPDNVALSTLARFFDTHLVLCYRNGELWYDAHPMVRAWAIELAGPPV